MDRNKMRYEAQKIMRAPEIRTFEMIQYVSAPLEGDITDWPANIQDAIYGALDRKATEVKLPLSLVLCYCDEEPADEEGGKVRYFVRAIASEIVKVEVIKGRLH